MYVMVYLSLINKVLVRAGPCTGDSIMGLMIVSTWTSCCWEAFRYR